MAIRQFNYNYLPENTFQIAFSRMPNLTFYAQGFDAPGLQLTSFNMSYPGNDFKTTAGQLQIDDVSIDFILDEQLQAYLEMYNWIRENNINSDQFINFSYSDIIIMPMAANSSSVIKSIVLLVCLPIRLSGLRFKTNTSDSQYLTGSATFAVNDIDIKFNNA